MNKTTFTELAWNNPREAIMLLWDLIEKAERERAGLGLSIAEELAGVKAELDATQATVIELAAAINAPTEESGDA